uniref:(California timema) hypothetical protein n=1 Tax=Timema californicum TaxID=61474 RepID=A0A7R9JAM3_TIMCA|nr:unnamed protein product [Timema californicum]
MLVLLTESTLSVLLIVTIVGAELIESDVVRVQKCCESFELMIDRRCVHQNDSDIEPWTPMFTSETGHDNVQVPAFKFVIGIPECGSRQQWPIYHYPGAQDRLSLLPSGRLRHYISHHENDDVEGTLPVEGKEEHHRYYYEYDLGTYCLDKLANTLVVLSSTAEDREIEVRISLSNALVVLSCSTVEDEEIEVRISTKVVQDKKIEAQYAVVCAPEVSPNWNNTDYLIRRLVDPVLHGVAITCFTTVSIIYFVLPQLRDLVGNIISTVTTCLVACQAADLVGIFVEYRNHLANALVVLSSTAEDGEIEVQISLANALVVLSSTAEDGEIEVTNLGRLANALVVLSSTAEDGEIEVRISVGSRNVFLRVTDGRKYCYYSMYAWGSTLTMTLVALFAHFFLDTGNPMSQPSSIKQDNVGWLGIAMFFTPVGFTILVNIFFYLTTGQIINRMSTYGRIHHKMKYNFDMFVKLFLVMSLSWLFLLLSWLKFDVLVYCHIGANALQAPLVLYICVLGQKRVRILLRKTCCYEGCPCTCCRPGPPQEGMDWGEEMMTMNTAHY